MGRTLKPVTLTAMGVASLAALAQTPQFGTEQDQAFGNSLWNALEAREFVGDDAIMAHPYEGTDPHGSVLVTLEGDIEVNGERGAVIVKRNYAGQGATIESVSNDPQPYLMATTVMFRREGFAPDNGNWFWAKYLPDGSYDTAPNGTPLVGAAQGCISCHSQAPGDDMVYLNDRY